MRREWRLNPPPNWPVTADAATGLDWRPDPAWGPPPVGWPLWQRRRTGRPRVHRLLGTGALGLALSAAVLAGALVGEPAAPTAPGQEQAAVFGTARP